MELCKVPPGQLVRKEMSPDQIRHILGFSGLPPRHREGRILDGLAVGFDWYIANVWRADNVLPGTAVWAVTICSAVWHGCPKPSSACGARWPNHQRTKVKL